MTERVYLDYTQAELDKAYDQRLWADNAGDIMAEWRDAHGLREVLGCAEVQYGNSPREAMDIYPAPAAGVAPIHFHIHGGGWRMQSKEDCAFLAPTQQSLGFMPVFPDFDQLPDVTLTMQYEQLRQAFITLQEMAKDYGGDTGRIVVSGHSSGAHLAALLAEEDWTEFGLPADIIKSLILISGPHDLEPVLLSARREYVHLEEQAAGLLNAYRRADRINCPVQIYYGEHESPEFKRQSIYMAERLKTLGSQASCTMITGVNHFEILNDMNRDDSQVFQAVKKISADFRNKQQKEK